MKRAHLILIIVTSILFVVQVGADSGKEAMELKGQIQSFVGPMQEYDSLIADTASVSSQALFRQVLRTMVDDSMQAVVRVSGFAVSVPDTIRQLRRLNRVNRDLGRNDFDIFLDGSSGRFVAAVSGSLEKWPSFDSVLWVEFIGSFLQKEFVSLTATSVPPQVSLLQILQSPTSLGTMIADHVEAYYLRAIWTGPEASREFIMPSDTVWCWLIARATCLRSEEVPISGGFDWEYEVRMIDATSGNELFVGYKRPYDPYRFPDRILKQK